MGPQRSLRHEADITDESLVEKLRAAEAKRDSCRKERERIELLLAGARANEKYAEKEFEDVVDRIENLP